MKIGSVLGNFRWISWLFWVQAFQKHLKYTKCQFPIWNVYNLSNQILYFIVFVNDYDLKIILILTTNFNHKFSVDGNDVGFSAKYIKRIYSFCEMFNINVGSYYKMYFIFLNVDVLFIKQIYLYEHENSMRSKYKSPKCQLL